VITHPEKVLFPDDGITKGELAAYYESVAPVMLPHIAGRPVTMERYPNGIGAEGFIHKSVTRGFPEWLERVDVPKRGGRVHYPLAGDRRSLEWIANQNTVTIHVWPSRVPRLDRPDLCVFDLDPSHDDEAALTDAVLGLRDLLEASGHRSWVKTSGSKGYHVVVPMPPGATYRDSGRLADDIANRLVESRPTLLTLAFNKADRGGRIYVDTGRNRPGATFAAAYTVRPKPGAPVSAPCLWEEIEQGLARPRTFTLRTMKERVESVGDLWSELATKRPSRTTRSFSAARRSR
jgi:bifunctional non-homologous end joining protein LigD